MKHVDGEKPAVSPRRTSECYLFGLVRIAKIRRCRDTHGSNALPVLDAFGSECLYMVRVRNIWEQLHVTLGGCALPVSRLVTASVHTLFFAVLKYLLTCAVVLQSNYQTTAT